MPSSRAIRTLESTADHGEAFVFRGLTNRLSPSTDVHDRSPPPVLEVNEPTDVIPGNTTTTFSLALGAIETGVVNTPGDDDWFRVDLVAGQSYLFTLTGSGGTPVPDTYLELRNSSGALIAIDDDAGPASNSLLRFTAVESGAYFVNARAFEEETGAEHTGGYTITFNTGPAQNPLDTLDMHFMGPTNIEIYFATSGQTFQNDTAARDWTSGEISAVFASLATISAVAPLTFSQTTTQASAEWTLTIDTDLGDGVLGHFFVGAPGYGAFDPNGSGWSSLTPGSLGWVTLIHEFLHGLGLAHPHDNAAVNYGVNNSEIMQGVVGPFSSYGTFLMNQGAFTTMTYNDGWQLAPGGPNSSETVGSQATPMALDIAFLQQLYGVNPTTNSGNTTYTLTGVAAAYEAIWDTGGADVIRYDGAVNTVIDLRTATLLSEIGGGGYVSHVNGIHQGFTIANGVTIENATGGSGSDFLTGNAADNELRGNGGADAIEGGAGVDTAVYGIASSSASFTRAGSGWSVIAEGSDSLSGVEYLRFSDRTLALRPAEGSVDGAASDIVLRNASSGAIAVWQLTGAAVSSATIVGASDATYQAVASGDFNGDGRYDILFRNAGGILAQWQFDGASVTGAAAYVTDSAWALAGVGDFTGDHRDDILWRHSSGLLAQWQMDGLAVSAVGVFAASDPAWALSAIADFNGDGHDDFLWRHSSGALAQWSLDGFDASNLGVFALSDTAWNVVGTGDFNGDLREDIMWRHSSGVMALWHMDGTTVTSVGTFAVSDTAWNVSDIGDYNGDGRDDILWQGPDGTFALWTMNGFTVLGSSVIGNPGVGWGDI